MREADGISLTSPEYSELVHVRDYGKEGRRTYKTLEGTDECRSLCGNGLIDFRYDSDGVIDEAWITNKGLKWLASYEAGEAEKRKLRWESAAISGIVSLAVSLAAHFVTHL